MLKVGDRIRLLEMPGDPCPIPAGTTGTVRRLGERTSDHTRQVFVSWDCERSLILIDGLDRYEIIKEST